MRRWAILAVVALWASSASAVQLASISAGEQASGEWSVAAPFSTAEMKWTGRLRIDGPGVLELCYPGDGSTVLRTFAGATDGWQEIALHLRVNPPLAELRVRWLFTSETGAASCWLEEATVEPLYQHHIPKIDAPPVIDGDLSDACWNAAAYVGDPYWRMYNEARDARMATEVWCCYDDENLYVAFRCETSDVEKLVSRVSERDGFAWRDDSAEIFFDIGHDHDTYYEYIINPDEVVFDSKWFYEGGEWLSDWNYIGEWKTAVDPGAWLVEIRLALESYEERDLHGRPTGFMPLPTGDVAGILFSRNDRVLGESMSHADCVGSFHEVHQYGHLVGFRPNRIEAYRNTALRELETLGEQWRQMFYGAGQPDLSSMHTAIQRIPDALADLRGRIEAPAPTFEDWVAIGADLDALEERMVIARSAMAPLIARHRDPDARWAVAVADVPRTPPALVAMRDALQLEAARGETEGAALAIWPLSGAVDAIRVQTTPLHGPGDTIAATAIDWFRVGADGVLTPELAASGEHPTFLWWEVRVPRGVRPGTYRGEIITTDGENSVSLPVTLTVHDFVLPETPSLAVSVALDSPGIAQAWYGDRAPLGAGEYWPFVELLLRHRVVPREMLADLTHWSDGEGLSLSRAERLLDRATAPGVRSDALIAARPENLSGLDNPARALARALDRWERTMGQRPIPVYADPGAELPVDLREIDRLQSIAAVDATDGPSFSAALLGTWAISPEAATGVGDCAQARLAALAARSEKSLAWRIAGAPRSYIDGRMVGWIAEDRGVGRIFWDAGGLVRYLDGDQPLRDPCPTVMLKAVRDGVEDYQYLTMLNELNALLGKKQVGDRMWRLRLANQTTSKRNWDMVMNVRSYSRDYDHLLRRRQRIARQIERSRRWLRALGVEGELPGGEPTAAAPR